MSFIPSVTMSQATADRNVNVGTAVSKRATSKNVDIVDRYDTIVIGSGWGGLTTASLLAQVGKERVLVLERHFKLGGFTHSFRRKRYQWDVGVHYVGSMQKGTLTRRMMDLVSDKRLDWHRMGTPIERFVFPEGRFEVPDNSLAYQRKLIERFPDEAKQIRRYFKDLQSAANWIRRWTVTKIYGDPITALLKQYGKTLAGSTTAERLSHFKDPLLRAFLGSQWPDYGAPPSESAFAMHAVVAADYLDGAYYPVGGAQEMSNCAAVPIEARGGACLVNHTVKEIIVENNRAVGVVAEHKGKEVRFLAPKIVSNAGVWTTFNQFVSEQYCQPEREKLQKVKVGPSALILFVGLKDDPRKHGFDDANNWVYDDMNHRVCTNPQRVNGQGGVHSVFVSFGSIRNPGQEPHTAQVALLCDQAVWEKYDRTRWMRRGDEYDSIKAAIAEDMLQMTEKYLPGFRAIVDFHELSTPMTVTTFTGYQGGMIYGQPCDPDRFFRDDWKVGTSLRNLFMTGSDVGTPGVNGAMIAGMLTAARLLGPMGMPRILRRAYFA